MKRGRLAVRGRVEEGRLGLIQNEEEEGEPTFSEI